MKLVALFLLSLFVASCGKHETKYLISKYDGKKYQALRAFAMKRCQSESTIFKKLQGSNTIENWESRFKGRIYRSVEKTQGDITKTRYFKVHKIEGDQMEIIMNSSVSGESKLIVFHREEDGVNILKEVSEGVCHEPEPLYSHSSLDDKRSLKFSQARQEGSSTNYDKIVEEFILDTQMPLVLFYWSGVVKSEVRRDDEKVSKVHNRDLDIIDSCPSGEELCTNFPNPATLSKCEVQVTKNAATNDDDVDLSLISLDCSVAAN